MVHVPVATIVMFNPDVVHTLVVDDAIETANAELEVGATTNGEVRSRVPGFVNVMVWFALPNVTVVAADIAYAVPLTLVAGLGHATLGSVDWSLLGWLLIGSLPGIWIGSRWVHKTPERFIRSVLSVLLAWAGTKLVMA